MTVFLFSPMYVITIVIFIAYARIFAQRCEILNWDRRPQLPTMLTPTNIDIYIHVSVLRHSKCDLYEIVNRVLNMYIEIINLC